MFHSQYNTPIENPFLLTGLVLLSSLSPLCTLAALWQTKEWRIDRIKEHFRAEGLLKQLFGIVRPLLLGIVGILGILGILPHWPFWLLLILSSLTVIQFALKRQRSPVWTKKALILTRESILITLALSILVYNLQPTTYPLAVLPYLQPLVLACSWLTFLPIDKTMKSRIMMRAKKIREQFPDLTVIGITGSVGKTTTKELLAHLLSDLNPLVTPAYVNSDMGVANWLLQKLPPLPTTNYQLPTILIAELGAYRRGEIALLCEIVKPQMGIITFIGKQHIALFGSQMALCEAKAELFDALPEHGHAFLNADCELCMDVIDHAKCPVTTVGTGGYADMEAFDIEETADGITFRIGEMTFTVPLHGTHNVSNVLLAIAVARKIGLTEEQILQKLRSFRPPSHTFSVRTENGHIVLDDTHNASPASFKSAIAWARTQPTTKKVLLTSGLMELGAEQDQIHTELGMLASGIFTRVIITNKRAAEHFGKGYGNPVDVLSKETEPIEENALLACVGRVPEQTINRLLRS